MDDHIWGERHKLLFRVRLSSMYHQKRARWFDAWDRVFKAIAVIGGGAAVSSLLPAGGISVAAATVAVTSTLSLVFNLSGKARDHSDLAQLFRGLQAEIVEKGELTDSDIATFEARIVRAEIRESRPLATLVAVCQNELAIAEGQPEKVVTIGLWRRALMHFVDSPLPQPQR